jgi:tripartite-type tricarboxylate transporter receptor subunit TctC
MALAKLACTLTALVSVWCAAVAISGAAQRDDVRDWPRRPIRVIVPAAPGGAGDITARTISPALADYLGQQIVIDDRPGAAGNIGVELAAKAPPDGYTVLIGNVSTNAINPTTFASVLKFDPSKELAGVTMLSRIPNLLVSGTSFPPNDIAELIDYAKARPGQLNYSNPVGGVSHLDMLEFTARAGIKMVNVPSKGAGSSFAPVISSEIHCTFLNAATVIPQIRAGRMKAFVTTAQRRLADLPNIPTMAEAGFPGAGSEMWTGFFVPASTPRAIIAKLHGAVVQVAQQRQVKDMFDRVKVPMAISATPEEFQEYVRAEIKRWAAVIKDNNVKVQ